MKTDLYWIRSWKGSLMDGNYQYILCKEKVIGVNSEFRIEFVNVCAFNTKKLK